jgi:hypothetical protein
MASGLSIMVASALVACGPGLSPGDGDGGGSSSGATTQATTGGVGFVDEELWRLSLDRTIWTEPPVGDASGNVYVVAARPNPADPGAAGLRSLIKVSEQGELVWELDFGSDGGFSAVAVGPDGDVWACIRGSVSRVSANGSLLWTEDDTCTGERSITVGNGVAVSVHLRRGDENNTRLREVIAIGSDGTRLWARDVGVPVPHEENQFERLGTLIFGTAISGTSVYVGCDICAAQPALVELDLADGSIRSVGELDGGDWIEPRKTVFEVPRVTADGIWVEAYESSLTRRTWHWSAGSAAASVEVSLPIEAETGLTHRDYSVDDVQLIIDGEARLVDFGDLATEERAQLVNSEPAARGSDDAILMVSVADPEEPEYPRLSNCWGESCRVYVVDASGRVTWILGEEVVQIPYIGDGRVVYVARNGDLVAHSAPLTPLSYGWAQWLANGQGNSCRDCAG